MLPGMQGHSGVHSFPLGEPTSVLLFFVSAFAAAAPVVVVADALAVVTSPVALAVSAPAAVDDNSLVDVVSVAPGIVATASATVAVIIAAAVVAVAVVLYDFCAAL